MLGSWTGFAQNPSSVEHGPVVAVDWVSTHVDDLRSDGALAAEVGYGARLVLNPYLSVSVDARFRALQRQFEYAGTGEQNSRPFIPGGPVGFVFRNGSVDYTLRELSFPLVFRYRPFRKAPVAVTTGLAFNYRLYGRAQERYDRFLSAFNGTVFTETLLEEGVERDWEFVSRNRPWLPLGLAFQGARLGADLHLKTAFNRYRTGASNEGVRINGFILAIRYRLAAVAPTPLLGEGDN